MIPAVEKLEKCSAGERGEMVRARNTAKAGVFTGRRNNPCTRLMKNK
jgi:hypothetical protein